jgi:hypothetical protein
MEKVVENREVMSLKGESGGKWWATNGKRGRYARYDKAKRKMALATVTAGDM